MKKKYAQQKNLLQDVRLWGAPILTTSLQFSAALLWAALPGIPATPNPDSSGLQEVVIHGGERSGVGSKKPPLEIKLNPDEPILPAMAPEEDLLQKQPESLMTQKTGLTEPLASLRAILPARIRLAKDPVKTFYPLRQIMATSPSLSQEIGSGWEMAITDTDGRSFRKFSGGGLPPATIEWNGQSDRSEVVSAGKTYSTVITYRDIRGHARNLVGDPFSFDGVIHQEPQGLVITLSLESLFDKKLPNKTEETIGDLGNELLEETADWVKRYYFTYPVKVQCYCQSQTQAISKAKLVADVLTSSLILTNNDIPANGTVSDANNERVDIIITNR